MTTKCSFSELNCKLGFSFPWSKIEADRWFYSERIKAGKRFSKVQDQTAEQKKQDKKNGIKG